MRRKNEQEKAQMRRENEKMTRERDEWKHSFNQKQKHQAKGKLEGPTYDRCPTFERMCGELQKNVSARVRDTMRALEATYGVSEAVGAVLS